jgi:transposase
MDILHKLISSILDENGLDGYIPNRKQVYESKPRLNKNKPFSKHNFKYNYEKDFYICPNSKKLTYQRIYNYKNVFMRQYYCNDRLKCHDQLECVGKDRLRVITDYGGALSKQMAWKMETPEGKKRVRKTKTNRRMAVWKHKRKFKVHKIHNTWHKWSKNK